MKIAVFHNLPPGGAKRTLFEQMKFLSSKHTLHLYEHTSTGESFMNTKQYTKKVFQFPFQLKSKFPSFLSRIEKDYKNFIRLASIHKRMAFAINNGEYDVALIHADKFTQAPFVLQYLSLPSLYFSQEYLRIAYEKELKFEGKEILIKRFYEKTTRAVRKEIDKKNAKSSNLILTNSNFTKDNIFSAYGVKSQVCHLGVDTNTFFSLTQPKKNLVLFIGEKNKVNDYSLAVKAIKLIDKKIRPKLTVIGLKKNKLRLTDNQLASEYSSAIVTLCTSFNEPFGLASLESMACRTPVLAVDQGGYKETVLDGKTGFLLNRDPQKFADKIKLLIKNPKITYQLGESGIKHVSEKFTWNKHNSFLENSLREITK